MKSFTMILKGEEIQTDIILQILYKAVPPQHELPHGSIDSGSPMLGK